MHITVYPSRVVRKPVFCICENKDADQLRGNREADQHLCFASRIVQFFEGWVWVLIVSVPGLCILFTFEYVHGFKNHEPVHVNVGCKLVVATVVDVLRTIRASL